jgi:hypothetical protein
MEAVAFKDVTQEGPHLGVVIDDHDARLKIGVQLRGTLVCHMS